IAFDMVERRTLLVSNGLPERNPETRARRAKARALAMRARIAAAKPFIVGQSPSRGQSLTANFTRHTYEAAVAQIVDLICAGDIFQANLTQRFETTLSASDTSYGLYLRLRALSPAPF